MNEQKNPSAGLGLGIAGLVLGIIAIPFGLWDCTFVLALVMGILGITLSAVGYSQAKQANSPTGLIISALIISIIATFLALINFTDTLTRSKGKFNTFKNRLQELEDDTVGYSTTFEDAFKEGFKEDTDESVTNYRDLEEELEKLEKELESAGREIEKSLEKMNEKEKIEKLGRATGKAVRGFIEELKDSV